MYQNFNELLALQDNQIIIKLEDTLNTEIKNNEGSNNLEITNCFETIMGGWGCYSPGKEQGISELVISNLVSNFINRK